VKKEIPFQIHQVTADNRTSILMSEDGSPALWPSKESANKEVAKLEKNNKGGKFFAVPIETILK